VTNPLVDWKLSSISINGGPDEKKRIHASDNTNDQSKDFPGFRALLSNMYGAPNRISPPVVRAIATSDIVSGYRITGV
jgi:hypothetical protein